jgi:hypothetical protein
MLKGCRQDELVVIRGKESLEIVQCRRVSLEFLWLRRGDSSGSHRKGNASVGNRYQKTGEDRD